MRQVTRGDCSAGFGPTDRSLKSASRPRHRHCVARRLRSDFDSKVHLHAQHKIRIGSCGWSFADWRGSFYPSDLPESHWLEFYARYFHTVEMDATFHKTPDNDTVRRWVEATPASFRFVCKLPREISHVCRLHDCSRQLNEFLSAIEPLQAKTQVILLQLPPSFTPKEGRTPLRNFLKQLPRDFRFAIEFRNPGWHRPQVIGLLEKFRVCWVWADTTSLNERNLAPFEFLPLTCDFLYLRLLGDYMTKYDEAGLFVHRYDKLLWKREAALESWSVKIQRHLEEARNVWCFVGNHYEGFAPETAQRLAQRLGFELTLPGAAEKDPSTGARGQLDLFAAEAAE